MKVSQLLDALKGCNPDANIHLFAARNPHHDAPDTGSGAPIYIAVTAVDGTDRLVVLSNVLADKQGQSVFDAPPQFKRFSTSSNEGLAVAAADLREQMNCESAVDLDAHLEVSKVKDIFRSLETMAAKARADAEAERFLIRVFLVVDATGRYAHVRMHGSKSECINALEDAGAEVVEEQTEDYEGEPSTWEGTCTLQQLIDSPDFIPHS
jgi:hypothetical protein